LLDFARPRKNVKEEEEEERTKEEERPLRGGGFSSVWKMKAEKAGGSPSF